MNKGRRNELKRLKFNNRLKRFGLKMNKATDWKCYRTTSTPCSCYLCQPEKYKRSNLQFVLRTDEELIKSRVSAYEYLIR